jgi:hypothetical protein
MGFKRYFRAQSIEFNTMRLNSLRAYSPSIRMLAAVQVGIPIASAMAVGRCGDLVRYISTLIH